MASNKLNKPISILCALIILLGFGSRIYIYVLSLSNYPLTTDWSESGRIFEAASIYAPLVFGRILPWPWLDPGRAILDGLVFLIPNSQIWMYRFWIAFLSLSTSILTAYLVIKRALKKVSPSVLTGTFCFILLVGWGTLFLLQCPIYYHLLLGAIIVLWLLDLDKPLLVLGVVIIASVWEGLGRVNWFLMPAVLAVTIYLITIPFTGNKSPWYLMWPAIWMIGGALSSVLTYGLFIKFSHNIIPFFNPNMHYGFFKFKLWPNAGFGLGLIPGIILLSLPVGLLIAAAALRGFRNIHWIRSFAMLGILGVFFIGSTIVSLRAGGGFDMHNYDTFVLLLFVVGSYWGSGAFAYERMESDTPKLLLENRFIFLGLLIIPIFFSLRSIPSRTNFPELEAKQVLQKVNNLVQKTDIHIGPVLFIDYRHLLVYQMIQPVEFHLPYEKIDLMEMAMANNRPYLDQFWNDIEAQKFPLIISEKLQLAKQDVNAPLGNENNIWVVNVSEPILRYYQLIFSEAGLAVYAPK